MSMRKLMTLVFVLAIAAGIALYMGWLRLGSDKSSDKPNVTITVDRDKLNADKEKAVDNVKQLGRDGSNKVDAAIDKSLPPTSQPAQQP